MEPTQTAFLDPFYKAFITSGALAASYKAKLIARAANAIVACLDAGVAYDKIVQAVTKACSERNTVTKAELAKCPKEDVDAATVALNKIK
jgi:hypothetical protein